jgi:hypothetical protein
MSYGKDERDIAKHIWQLPIPEFDSADRSHIALAKLGREAQTAMDVLPVDEGLHFSATRRRFRESLETHLRCRRSAKLFSKCCPETADYALEPLGPSPDAFRTR